MLIPFSPPPGLNSDDTSFSATGRWVDGLNVRFWEGKPQVRGGVFNRFSIATTNGVCRCILPFVRSGTLTLAYGMTLSTSGSAGTTKLYVGSGVAAPSDRTPAGLAGTERNWSLAPWGSTLLACPEGGTLYEQTGTSTATAVTEAPDAITYMLTTPQRQVVALGCNEVVSGTFNGLCIRISDIEDYSSAGSWTPTATNNSDEIILDGPGSIIAGRMVGSYLAVWTDVGLYLGTFVGDPSQTYRFDPVAQSCGLIGPNAVVVVNGTAYWMDPGLGFNVWTPGDLPKSLPCPISKKIADEFARSKARYVVASYNSSFEEIRFDWQGAGVLITAYPTSGINQYVAVCLRDGSWHIGNHGMSAIVTSDALVATTASSNPSAILGADERGDFWSLDIGSFLSLSASPLTPFLKSADWYLDESQRRVMIRGIIQDIKDQLGPVDLTLFAKDRPQSTAVTKGPYSLTTSSTKKDFRVSGKIVSVKFTSNNPGDTTYWRLGKPLFDVVPMGLR